MTKLGIINQARTTLGKQSEVVARLCPPVFLTASECAPFQFTLQSLVCV